MLILCVLAMIMLHGALLKVLQIFFDNFQSDFRGQEVTGNPQTHDAEENTEIFQFNIAALYQLQLPWMTKYVRIYSRTQARTHFDACMYTRTQMQMFTTAPMRTLLSLSLSPPSFLVMSASLFPVS